MKKTVLITGASRGIGKAAATQFAKEGYDLILTCIHSEKALAALKDELTSTYKISVKTFVGDIGDYDTVTRLFNDIPHLDVLINNAGISHVGLLSDMTPDEWHHVMNTNLNSVFYTCKYAIPLMLQNHKGKIINISSVWGNVGASMEVAYSASKAGVNGFTRALAKELAPSNIQVNALACGLIDTDMNRCFSEEDMEAIIAEIPADRIGKAEEAAELLVQLAASPDYLTGQIITLDGGWI